MAQPKLIVLSEPISGEEFLLKDEITTIGRSRKTDIIIPDSTISGSHCSISLEHGKYVLRDLNSTNGTKVNEKRIAPDEPTVLKNGDILQFGGVETVFELKDGTGASQLSNVVIDLNSSNTGEISADVMKNLGNRIGIKRSRTLRDDKRSNLMAKIGVSVLIVIAIAAVIYSYIRMTRG